MSCRPPTRPDLPRQAPPQVDGAVALVAGAHRVSYAFCPRPAREALPFVAAALARGFARFFAGSLAGVAVDASGGGRGAPAGNPKGAAPSGRPPRPGKASEEPL